MKINDILLLTVLIFFAAAGWWIYRENFVFAGEKKTLLLKKLSEKALLINECSKKLDINPRLLASIIYAERRLNFNLLDSFDYIRAELGDDASVGFAQIRVSTAKWILITAKDSTSNYSLDVRYHKFLFDHKVATNDDFLSFLKNDSTNCLLAAFYVKQILERWRRAGFDISQKPNIVATLYSSGLFRHENGIEIVPHREPRNNLLGEVAAEFYQSSKLGDEFHLTN